MALTGWRKSVKFAEKIGVRYDRIFELRCRPRTPSAAASTRARDVQYDASGPVAKSFALTRREQLHTTGDGEGGADLGVALGVLHALPLRSGCMHLHLAIQGEGHEQVPSCSNAGRAGAWALSG